MKIVTNWCLLRFFLIARIDLVYIDCIFIINKTFSFMYKNNLYIAFLLLSVFFAFSETTLSASDITQCCADSIINVIPLPDPNPNIPRSPSIVPISASYESLISSIILSFNHNLGEIEVEVLNTFTGYYDSGFINTQFLSAIVPVTGGPGHYIITFTLPSGQQYQGELDI